MEKIEQDRSTNHMWGTNHKQASWRDIYVWSKRTREPDKSLKGKVFSCKEHCYINMAGCLLNCEMKKSDL